VRAGQYIGAGYTGNGMANCFAAGKALAEMISGQLQPEVNPSSPPLPPIH
jgi:glycine/D-amino acid oxidase-like deaminating enzyme